MSDGSLNKLVEDTYEQGRRDGREQVFNALDKSVSVLLTDDLGYPNSEPARMMLATALAQTSRQLREIFSKKVDSN